MEPTSGELQWNLVGYSDSDWAGDKDDRKSISGFILFLNGVPIMWRSKSQKTVALSSAEAEYVSASEMVKEIVFVVQVLLTMGIPVKTPIKVKVDNMGAIFMVENPSSQGRTRHVDTRWHYIKDFNGTLIQIEFVKSGDNVSDGFTKNVSGDIYERHAPTYIADRESVAGAALTLMDSTVDNRKGVGGCCGAGPTELELGSISGVPLV